MSVNGGATIEVLFPVTGYDWAGDLIKDFMVRLSGFNVDRENIITITADRYEGGSGLSGWAPDFDRIGVVG